MITLFTGAGASKPFGYPTTIDFFEDISTEFNSNDLFSLITNYHLRNDNTTKIDIEMILAELEEFKDLIKIINDRQDFTGYFLKEIKRWNYHHPPTRSNTVSKDAFASILHQAEQLYDKLNSKLYEHYWKYSDDAHGSYYNLYKVIESLSSQNIFNTFTTNYDTSIENCLDSETFTDYFDIVDGFKLKRGSLLFAKENLTKIRDNSAHKVISLHKVHGSINWKQFKEGDKTIIHKTTTAEHNGNHADHVIIYPGYKGEPDKEPFIFLHNRLKEVLLETKLCIVIGFAFRDKYINTIFDEAMKINKYLKLFIWNPMNVENEFDEERVYHHQDYFGPDVDYYLIEKIITDNKLL